LCPGPAFSPPFSFATVLEKTRFPQKAQGDALWIAGKEIDHLLRRVGAIEKHLGIHHNIAAWPHFGPEGEKKLIPVIVMVKGLAKTDPGVMTWVCEIGDDRILKVNGMSLGVNRVRLRDELPSRLWPPQVSGGGGTSTSGFFATSGNSSPPIEP
jgi:hypothetical protein